MRAFASWAWAAGLAAALGFALLAHGEESNATVQGEHTAGAATVFANGRNAFSFPLATLDDAERTRFAIGNSFFRRNWVEAPSSTQARDGLGPHFIARSCGGCHDQDGRGAPPEIRNGRHVAPTPGLRHGVLPLARGEGPSPRPGLRRQTLSRGAQPQGVARNLGSGLSAPHEAPVGLLLRLSVAGAADPRMGVRPEPTYGDQLHNAAVSGVRPEGRIVITQTPMRGRFADGTPYTLQRPRYRIMDLAYGPLAPDVRISPRVAPQLPGVGLIEAIPEAEIIANAHAQAAMPGPIKGQVNRVWDVYANAERVGRFGWKANVASLAHQTVGAFLGDMGITSSKQPHEACMPAQKDCLAAPSGGKPDAPEIDDETLGNVIFYEATLGPAARRNIDDPRVKRGAALFEQAQCAACHRPSYVTGSAPNPALSSPRVQGLRIWPYTDLLLHDMGKGLADGRDDFQANGRQWRTPPLWGIGLIREVNGHERLLHDGRARGVLEAILWHGGEAEPSRQRVLKMNAAERAALVRFVESL